MTTYLTTESGPVKLSETSPRTIYFIRSRKCCAKQKAKWSCLQKLDLISNSNSTLMIAQKASQVMRTTKSLVIGKTWCDSSVGHLPRSKAILETNTSRSKGLTKKFWRRGGAVIGRTSHALALACMAETKKIRLSGLEGTLWWATPLKWTMVRWVWQKSLARNHWKIVGRWGRFTNGIKISDD